MNASPSIDLVDLDPQIVARAFASGDYPFRKRMKTKRYERELRSLQIELLKMQDWARASGARVVVVFEGRDAAGKGGTISRFRQHLNPRHARAVALSKPSDAERGQWYFQRYVAHLPTAGDITLFDRSWYNRAGVERVMGFCSEDQVSRFFEEAPEFEHALVRDGIHLFKFFLTIGREQQLYRFHRRLTDPLKKWKLSPIDLAAVDKWDDYSKARDDMLRRTHTDHAPWTVVRANDKRRARLNCLRTVLGGLDYADKNAEIVGVPDPKIVQSGEDPIA